MPVVYRQLNTRGSAVEPRQIVELIDRTEPNIVAFEEWASKEPIPWPNGWNAYRDGKRLLALRHTSCGRRYAGGDRRGKLISHGLLVPLYEDP